VVFAENRQLLQEAKLELKKSKRKDYYKVLGIAKDANEDAVKKAYRKHALLHHPGESHLCHLKFFRACFMLFLCLMPPLVVCIVIIIVIQ